MKEKVQEEVQEEKENKYEKMLRKIDELRYLYYSNEDDEEVCAAIEKCVKDMKLGELEYPIIDKKEGEETYKYVMLDDDYEFPTIVETTLEDYHDVSEMLYIAYTAHGDDQMFFIEFAIEPEDLFKLLLLQANMGIISISKTPYTGMNNVRYWVRKPYRNSFGAFIDGKKSKNSMQYQKKQ